MKRIDKVFSLPLPLGEMDCMVDVFIHSDADAGEPTVAMHTAHAINHVEALADALAAIVMNAEDAAFESWLDNDRPSGDASEVQYKFEQSCEFKDFIDEFGRAQAALKAYRGEA